MMRSLLVLGFPLVGLLIGCGDDRPSFEHLFYRDVSDAPGDVNLRPREIQLEAGIAVKARVSAMDSEGQAMELLSLESSDPSVFDVELGPELGEFVFFGVSAGAAELDVFSRRHFEASLPVVVVSPDGAGE
jgi:hypothetical protein